MSSRVEVLIGAVELVCLSKVEFCGSLGVDWT